jgi:Ran GTPase-activating protein (RanGAP) involved in mRNA processing and transport
VQVANFADIFTGRLLSEIPDALTHLLTSLLALPALHTVNLSDNAFGLNTVAPLQPFLSQHVPLQHLILNNNVLLPEPSSPKLSPLSPERKTKLARMARQCPILRLSSAVATDWRTAP